MLILSLGFLPLILKSPLPLGVWKNCLYPALDQRHIQGVEARWRWHSVLIWYLRYDEEARRGKFDSLNIYRTHLNVCLGFAPFYSFPIERLATKLPFFCNNSQCSTVEHFQTAVFYWDQGVFPLNSLDKFATLHKEKCGQWRKINEETIDTGWTILAIELFIMSWQICSDLIRSC